MTKSSTQDGAGVLEPPMLLNWETNIKQIKATKFRNNKIEMSQTKQIQAKIETLLFGELDQNFTKPSIQEMLNQPC